MSSVMSDPAMRADTLGSEGGSAFAKSAIGKGRGGRGGSSFWDPCALCFVRLRDRLPVLFRDKSFRMKVVEVGLGLGGGSRMLAPSKTGNEGVDELFSKRAEDPLLDPLLLLPLRSGVNGGV